MKNPTAFKIYKEIVNQLGLLFPFHERDIIIRKNPIPNNLEFHKKGIDRDELDSNMNDISKVYYQIFKHLGEDNFYKLHENNKIFNSEIREYPDRRINLSTVLSILYLSGFRNDELYKRGLEYLEKYGL